MVEELVIKGIILLSKFGVNLKRKREKTIDFYLNYDVLLLADTFEKSRIKYQYDYDLCPSYYLGCNA